MSWLKKILTGFTYGAGFTLGCMAVLAVSSKLWMENQVTEFGSMAETPTISSVPTIKDGFLGTIGCSSGAFGGDSEGQLAEGAGEIIGKVKVDGIGVPGLRVKLYLNGSVYSAWGESDSEGMYSISVPYGEYRVDGYSLDPSTAHNVLAGKIESPGHNCSGGRTLVAEGQAGRGLNFIFVEPIALIEPQGRKSVSQPIVARWDAYPGAHSYKLQVHKSAESDGWRGNDRVFDWRERPTVSSEEFDLADIPGGVEAGYWYTISIEALDEEGVPFASTADQHNHRDFEAIE